MTLPTAPVNLTSTISNATVILSWDEVESVPIVSTYTVEFSTDQTNWTLFSDTITDTTASVNPLENNQLFFFRVFAVNADGTSPASGIVSNTPENTPQVEYCTVKNIADRLRIDINANTDPNISMVDEYILDNQDFIDRETGHTWMSEKQMREEELTLTRIWDWGKGMPLYLKHRQMKLPLDTSKGDKIELWNGADWIDQDITDNDLFILDEVKGILYVRGYFFSFFRNNRFRLTYRYGGDQENGLIPKDIRKACILMTCIDILDTDFKMSQIGYGGEGNIRKEEVMNRWQKQIDKILRNRMELLTVF